jgi:hypothetical protein
MSKNRIIEDIMELTPIAKDSLTRMSVYDLTTLLNSLKGDTPKPPTIKPELVPQPPLKRVNKNKRNTKRVVKDEEPKEEPKEEQKNEIIEEAVEDEEDPFEEVEEDEPEPLEPIEPEPEPEKPKSRPTKKKKEKNPFNEPIPQPSTLKRTKAKVVNEKTECKDILTDFRKEVSKLIQQYKRVRTPQDHHKDKLCELYNEIYDKTCKYLNDTLETYRFVDESIYDYCNSMTDKEKVRIERLIGK